MTRSSALLIYDGDCAYCRGFARLLAMLDRRGRIRALPFDTEDARSLLRAQFGEGTGFAMYLVEPAKIHWGARAAERVTALLAAPAWITRLAFRSYPALVAIVSRLGRRGRAVCGPGCAAGASTPADHGTAPLTDEARHSLQPLLKHLPAEGSVQP
mgnify:CR=1 FL=1